MGEIERKRRREREKDIEGGKGGRERVQVLFFHDIFLKAV